MCRKVDLWSIACPRMVLPAPLFVDEAGVLGRLVGMGTVVEMAVLMGSWFKCRYSLSPGPKDQVNGYKVRARCYRVLMMRWVNKPVGAA